MEKEYFFSNKKMQSIRLEQLIGKFQSYDEFERAYPEELLNEDTRVGDYLRELVDEKDVKASKLSFDAHLAHSYVGNIINGKKNNPSRDALISICLTLGTTLEQVQYLLKYAGHSPLYVRRRRDVVIWYGFMKEESIKTVNENLLKRELKPLYKE